MTEVRVVPATEKDEDAIFRFLKDSFFVDEPLNSSLKRDVVKSNFRPLRYVRDGYSFLAYTKSEDGQEHLAGIVLNSIDRREDGGHRTKPEDKNALKIFRLLEFLDEKADIWSRIKEDVVFSTIILSVSRQHRGLNIGRKLVEASLKRAVEAGCSHATVECTSFFSARIVEKLGYERIFEVRYEDYRDEDGEVVFRVEKPHECIVKFLKTL